MAIRLLCRDECLDLLATVPIGRVAVSVGALPAIFPINFELDDDGVLFGAMADSRLAKATHGNIVAFQADAYDPIERSGWSVLGVGPATRLSSTNDPRHVYRSIPEPWTMGEAPEHLMRIELGQLSGHRIDSHDARGLSRRVQRPD
jgi:uncharacterized protein